MAIKMSRKQHEYILNNTHRWNLKIGAVRSGKSFVDVAHVIPDSLTSMAELPGLNVILGVSKETIERNVLQPMREKFTNLIVGSINNRNIAYVCGVPVYCLGAEKISQVAKIQGMSIKYCYGDEIAKWNQDVFYMLLSRLDKPYSKFDGACNPEYPGHWLKEFIDREDIDIYLQHYTIFDNPFLSKEFVRNLCKEYEGTVYYGRYINGDWTLAEGLIYPMYENAIADPPAGSKPTDYRLSIDYGTMNAFAALLWEKHGDVWYATKGYYYSGRDSGTTKTDEEYGRDLEGLVLPVVESNPSARKIKTIIDPSAASFIALLQKHRWFSVIPADNNVLDGIRDTATAMKLGLIKVSPSIKEWKSEAEGYVWDDSGEEQERPVKVNDHCLVGDTLVMTEDGEVAIADLVGRSGRVWSYNEKTGEVELKEFSDCRQTLEDAEIYEIETMDGRKILCTGDHPILTEDGWKKAMDLSDNDLIVCLGTKQ